MKRQKKVPTQEIVKKKKKYSVITPEYAVGELYRVYAEYPSELWNKLSDEEKRYIVTFTQNYEAGYFSQTRENVLPKTERVSAWARQRERRRDAMVVGNAKGAKLVPFVADGSIASYTTKSRLGVHDAGTVNETEDIMIENIDMRAAVKKARTAK